MWQKSNKKEESIKEEEMIFFLPLFF